jgi:REP element-mobilizing transposase RayT
MQTKILKMEYNPQIHHHRSIRLRNYNYAQEGLYFITICTYNRECLFGNIVLAGDRNQLGDREGRPYESEMILNEIGKIVDKEWNDLKNRFPHITLHAYCIMPNHFHGILEITVSPVPVGAGLAPAQNNDNATPVGAGLAPAQNNDNAIPVGARLAPAQYNDNATPVGAGLAPAQCNDNTTPVGAGLAPAPNNDNATPVGAGLAPAQCNDNTTPIGSGLAPAQYNNNATPVGSGLAPAQNNDNAIPVGAGLAPAQYNDNRVGAPVFRAGASPAPTVGQMIGAFKSLIMKKCLEIAESRNEYLGKLWQRNYFENIIRDWQSYQTISDYIMNNPAEWENDKFYKPENSL